MYIAVSPLLTKKCWIGKNVIVIKLSLPITNQLFSLYCAYTVNQLLAISKEILDLKSGSSPFFSNPFLRL